WIRRRRRRWVSSSLVRSDSPSSIFAAWIVGPLWNERCRPTSTSWTRSGWFRRYAAEPGTSIVTTSPYAARRSRSPSGSLRNARSAASRDRSGPGGPTVVVTEPSSATWARPQTVGFGHAPRRLRDPAARVRGGRGRDRDAGGHRTGRHRHVRVR